MADLEDKLEYHVAPLYGPAPTRYDPTMIVLYGPPPTKPEIPEPTVAPLYGPAPTRYDPTMIVLYGPPPTDYPEPTISPPDPINMSPVPKAYDVINSVNDIIKDLNTFYSNSGYTQGNFGNALVDASEDHIYIMNGLQVFSEESLLPAMKKVQKIYDNEETIASLRNNYEVIDRASNSGIGKVSSMIQALIAQNKRLRKQVNELAEVPIRSSATVSPGEIVEPVPTDTPILLYGPPPTQYYIQEKYGPPMPEPPTRTPTEPTLYCDPPSMFYVQEKYGPPMLVNDEPYIVEEPYMGEYPNYYVQEKYGPLRMNDDV